MSSFNNSKKNEVCRKGLNDAKRIVKFKRLNLGKVKVKIPSSAVTTPTKPYDTRRRKHKREIPMEVESIADPNWPKTTESPKMDKSKPAEHPKPVAEAMSVDVPKLNGFQNKQFKPKIAKEDITLRINPTRITMYPSKYAHMEPYVYITADKSKTIFGKYKSLWKVCEKQVVLRGAISPALMEQVQKALISKTEVNCQVVYEGLVNQTSTFKLTKNNI